MIHITAPHFCAGAVIINGRIVRAAPILGWTHGKSVQQGEAWCRRKGYEVLIT